MRLLGQLALLGLLLAAPIFSYADSRISAYALMSPSNQAMQNDMNLNPAMFWIMDGEALWADRNNPSNKACVDCHRDAKQSMKGVSATFPKRVQGKLLNLEGQINQCRTTRQQLPTLAYESKPLLALSTLIAYQSRGLAIQHRVTLPLSQTSKRESCSTFREWDNSIYPVPSVMMSGQA